MDTVEKIIARFLKENNYDGLCNSGIECQCFLAELVPCERPLINCKAGYLHLKDDGDWEIVVKKPDNKSLDLTSRA